MSKKSRNKMYRMTVLNYFTGNTTIILKEVRSVVDVKYFNSKWTANLNQEWLKIITASASYKDKLLKVKGPHSSKKNLKVFKERVLLKTFYDVPYYLISMTKRSRQGSDLSAKIYEAHRKILFILSYLLFDTNQLNNSFVDLHKFDFKGPI